MATRPTLPVTLGLLMGLAVLLQLGPVYWPGGGHLLAAASSLPVAVGAALVPRRAHWLYACAAMLLGGAALEEMFVFLTTTGPLGLMIGYTVRSRAFAAVLASAVVLSAGMLAMPALAGVRPFGGLEAGWSPALTAAAYIAFALAYAALWRLIFVRIWSRLQPALEYTRGQELQRSRHT